ncbi:hypothetical protein [Deinococcus planocerae]|uniref:hypothetical protein n=1 Tax=Deinococcus planocerae TaxID=1737569 RepID=UPI000C7F6B3D|nr:hypothetical protein [Deinococcus planocerae]
MTSVRALPLALLALLPACAPTTTTAPLPPAQYRATGPAIITAIARAAPTLKAPSLRQPWRPEEASNSSIVLRAYSPLGVLGGGRSLPVELLFNTVTSSGITTVTYSATPASRATVAEVFEVLDRQFQRVH